MKKTAFMFWIGVGALIVGGGPYFAQNILWFFTEGSIHSLIQGKWSWVVLYAAIFSLFSVFIFTNPLKKGGWRRSTNVYIAFIIALFAEMFGFPLTIYFLAQYLPLPTEPRTPVIAWTVEILGVKFSLLVTSLIAGIVSISSLLLIILGWRAIYRSQSDLVTDGVYGFVRHPQYLGILLIASIWLVAWPTILTGVMWPILVVSYYRLARTEEREMEKQFGEAYVEYKKRVSMLLPT